jgi:hypothetical protein
VAVVAEAGVVEVEVEVAVPVEVAEAEEVVVGRRW